MITSTRVLTVVFLVAGGSKSPSLPDAPVLDAPAADASAGCVPTTPSAETCDGVDSDRNGLVDDVDVGNDGPFDWSPPVVG